MVRQLQPKLIMKIKLTILALGIFCLSACSSNSGYVVSGTVTGLDGQLILQNNGKDDLTISKDGTFRFETNINQNEKFDVETFREPCEQGCLIENGMGTVNGKNIDNIKINCSVKTWTTSEKFLQGTVFEDLDILIEKTVVDRKGDAVVIWYASIGAHYYKSEYRNKKWIHPASLNDFLKVKDNPTRDIFITINDDGDSLLLVDSLDLNGKELLYPTIYKDGSWSNIETAKPINVPAIDVGQPKLILNKNDEAIVVWNQQDAYFETKLYKAQYYLGAWVPPLLLSDNVPTFTPVYSGDVAMDDNGNIVIVWSESFGYEDPRNGIYKSEFRNGVWSSDSQSSQKFNLFLGDIDILKLIMNSKGDALIVWSQRDYGDYLDRIFRSTYEDGVWIKPKSNLDLLNSPTDSLVYVDAKLSNSGYIGIFWFQDNDLFFSERNNNVWKTTKPNEIFSTNENINYFTFNFDINYNDDVLLIWNTQYGDEDHNPADYQTKIYKSQRKNGKWDWPVSNTDYFVKGWNSSSSSSTIDDNGDETIVWDIADEEKENVDFPNEHVYRLDYRLNHWSRDVDMYNDTFYHQLPYDNPSTPELISKDCHRILFWNKSNAVHDRIPYISEYR